jgi:hypothetical protein
MVGRESKVVLARKLRDEGWYYRAIASKLGVHPSMVSCWCNDLGKSVVKRNGLVRKNHLKRMRFYRMDRVSVDSLRDDEARVLAAILYWCEGSKYPSTTHLGFTSSDEQMQKVFIGLLRRGFVLDETKFRVWLQIHESHDRSEVIGFWSGVLSIPVSRFYRPKVTRKVGGKYRSVYHGTCSLRYYDYSMNIRLMGIYSRWASGVLRLVA